MHITAKELLQYHRQNIDGGDDECFQVVERLGPRLFSPVPAARESSPPAHYDDAAAAGLDLHDLEFDCDTLERRIRDNRQASLEDYRVQQYLSAQQAHRQQFIEEIAARGLHTRESFKEMNGTKVAMNY
ncbi:hypothetical protein DICA4_F14774 [Diutina catenulata]